MNKNDVIEYIKNNSKHPHAAMIAEWLLTGCEVKVYYDDLEQYVICEEPEWSPERKYILVQPKPAYRGFKLFARSTSIINRYRWYVF